MGHELARWDIVWPPGHRERSGRYLGGPHLRTVIRDRPLIARIVAKGQHASIRVDVMHFTEAPSTLRKPIGNPAPPYRARSFCRGKIGVGRLLLFSATGTVENQD